MKFVWTGLADGLVTQVIAAITTCGIRAPRGAIGK